LPSLPDESSTTTSLGLAYQVGQAAASISSAHMLFADAAMTIVVMCEQVGVFRIKARRPMNSDRTLDEIVVDPVHGCFLMLVMNRLAPVCGGQ